MLYFPCARTCGWYIRLDNVNVGSSTRRSHRIVVDVSINVHSPTHKIVSSVLRDSKFVEYRATCDVQMYANASQSINV